MAIVAAENDTKAGEQNAADEQVYWRIIKEGIIRKGIPDEDIPPGNGFPDYTVIEDKRGGWESNSGRPAYNIPTNLLERFHPPTEWNDDMLAFRVTQIQWTGNWSDDRAAMAMRSMRTFIRRLVEGRYQSADNASDGAVAVMEELWPTWTGTRTREAVRRLASDIYESTWRPNIPDQTKQDMVTERVMAFKANRGGTDLDPEARRNLIAVLHEMILEEPTFASDGERWKAVHDRCKKRTRDWHMGYSDVSSSLALRDLLRELWPDTIVIPDHIAAMDEQELRSTLTTFEAREKAAHAELWRKAEERGWCPEFDAILVRAGYPPRPKTYSISYSVTVSMKPTPQDVEQWTGQKITFEPGAVTQEATLRFSFTHRAGEPPTKEEARALLTDEMIHDDLNAHYGVEAEHEIGAVTIGTITAR